VTVYYAKGGYSGETREVLVCVITRLEAPGLKNLIYETDPNAFVLIHALREASGGMIKHRPFAGLRSR
ncbi:MAG: YitT family protein, partial [Bacteroidia bacterium]|nr:YitT family protein [Bacteroidia bacterium]